MRRRYLITAVGLAVLSLFCTGTAYADSLAPLLIPGFSTSSVNWIFLIPTILLVTVLEVPYVYLAGVRERTWRRTLIANVISTAAGIVFPAYSQINYDLLVVAAIVLTIFVEGLYLSFKASARLNWGWVAVGNITSSVVLMFISSFLFVAIDRAPNSLRDLGAHVYFSWYTKDYRVSCVNPGNVTDATLKQWVPHLEKLRVRALDLNDSQVTDNGLSQLATVSTLLHLSVTNTKVTEAGVKRLQDKLPRVNVYPLPPKSETSHKPTERANTDQPQSPPSVDQP
jgi:hypothetical protein